MEICLAAFIEKFGLREGGGYVKKMIVNKAHNSKFEAQNVVLLLYDLKMNIFHICLENPI